MAQELLRAKIETPMSKNNPEDVKVESIPLPPKEMWDQLDNSSGSVTTETVAAPAPAAPIPVRYFGNVSSLDVPLNRAYAMPDGSSLTSVTVRRLTLGEVQDLLEQKSGQTLPLIEIYAEMTGLPAEAILGLDDDDGVMLTDAAYGFLPRRFKEDASSET